MKSAAEILTKCENRIVYLAKHYSRLGVDRDDLAQEGRIALCKALEGFDGRGEVWTYAKHFVKGAMLRFLTKELLEPRPDAEDDGGVRALSQPDETPNAEESALAAEDLQTKLDTVRHVLSQLLEREREIVRLHLEQEASFGEIARALGLSQTSTFRTYQAAMVTLRERVAA